MNLTGLSNEELLAKGRVAATNANEYPEIKDRLTSWGLDEAQLALGLTLVAEAEKWLNNKDYRYADQVTSTGVLSEDSRTALDTFVKYRRLSDAVVGNHLPFRNALGLDYSLEQRPMDVFRQAKQFYENGLNTPDLLTLLTSIGLSAEKLQAGLDQVLALDKGDSVQESSKGLAQQATQERNLAFDKLVKWLKMFYRVCEIVFVSEPDRQTLERLGMPALTTKRKKKTTTPPPQPEEPEVPAETGETGETATS